MVERKPSKLHTWVRFPSPAPTFFVRLQVISALSNVPTFPFWQSRFLTGIRFLKYLWVITRCLIVARSQEENVRRKEELLPTRRSLLDRLRNWEDQTSWQDFFNTYWKFIYGVAIRSGL